tara:strand:- start:69 stop:359 length:291 start_codon:yes stop_codon:yes gene_type:complete
MEVKQFEANVVRTSKSSEGITVPKWVQKAFDIKKGDKVIVQLKKVVSSGSQNAKKWARRDLMGWVRVIPPLHQTGLLARLQCVRQVLGVLVLSPQI